MEGNVACFEGSAAVQRRAFLYKEDLQKILYQVLDRGGAVTEVVWPGHATRVDYRGMTLSVIVDGEMLWERVYNEPTPEQMKIAARIARFHSEPEEEIADLRHQPNPEFCQGYSAHVDASAAPMDSQEWRALKAAGWTVVRKVDQNSFAGSRGEWHTTYHEQITVRTPEGRIAVF